jgi:hypothetical protein
MSLAPVPPNATLLLIFGADRDDQIRSKDGRVTVRGSSDLFGLIDPDHPHHRLQITRQFLRQNRRPNLTRYHVLLNLITEPEHNDQVLANMGKLLRNVPGRVINRPEAVLRSTRDQMAKRLSDIAGLLAPKVVRLKSSKPAIVGDAVARAGIPFPLILREPGTHLGTTQSRCEDLNQLLSAMSAGKEYFATQFVDFRSIDGLYRKYRVFFIGPHILFRHMLVSDCWNVHAKDAGRFMFDRPDLRAEEEAMFAVPEGTFSPEIRRVLAEVRERIDLDFFGIDFGILPDGRAILFEANATMNFFLPLPGEQFYYLRACVPPARAAFRELLGLPPSL